MKLRIYPNELDPLEFSEKEYECLLKDWMNIREEYPEARLYKDSICAQNDVTPKTREEALQLLHADGDYFVLCHAGEPLTIFLVVVTVLSAALAIYTYMNMPEIPDQASGSGNNSLASRQNKHRTSERVPDIYGKVKSIPDLIAPLYRYYTDNVQVEEALLSIGTGYFETDPDQIKEGETPINTIEGASLSVYEPNTLTTGAAQIQIGEVFNDPPIVAKQVSSVDGKQKLISPNNTVKVYKGVSFNGNTVSISGSTVQGKLDKYSWNSITAAFLYQSQNVYADFNDHFVNGEQIIIENAIYGSAPNSNISGTTDVSAAGILTIASSVNISDPDSYKKIRISSLTIDDLVEGQLNLAGEYSVSSITKTGSTGAWFYEVELASSYMETNINFGRMSADGTGILSAVLTDHDENIDLSGTYTISSVSANDITLVNPASVNPDWLLLSSLTQQQIADMLGRSITFKGTSENFIGWYYAGNKDTEGMMLNFLAANGIYEGDRAKQVAIEVHYQQVVDGVPTGQIYKTGISMQGKANNRDQVGATVRETLPFTGQFRFRAKRINDNGSSANLIDDVVFESAYSFYETKKLAYEHDTTIRLKRLAIGSGTNASELNLPVTRKLYSYRDGIQSAERIPTSNFVDIVINMALDPFIGRFDISEIDVQSLYEVSNEIEDYFGTTKACEFNYTFDNKNSSYQEMAFAVAEAVFCTARRENGKHFFTFEKETPNSLILFNHRNIKPESLTKTNLFGAPDEYEGVEFKWRDATDDYAEAVIKLPHDGLSNYKTIESNGVTNAIQAHLLAHRAWNKMQFNRKTIEFTAYGEADLVTRNDRIAIVDDVFKMLGSGEVEAQNNTVLTLDNSINLDEGESYVIHLQLKDGSVDVINIVNQLDENQVELARIPLMPLVIDKVVNATYSITKASAQESEAYLIQEKSPSATFETGVSAINYDTRYYSNDKDHINNLI
ncbi:MULTISPECIES: host specificity factor TipJ family phage tail protein [Acinetobacter]|uniref:host specificity factor TipJ family phage tail protein n=1 Tax=Acinetobacter TaxID=469 RepID=UPI0015D193FC|nr:MULTISPECIES: host specificity factor TipJ family phage tail protein [Acinetobacter]MCP0910787.1 host specificity factor TipJ family phage tail protein [Acinetobacter pseudolwoffii]